LATPIAAFSGLILSSISLLYRKFITPKVIIAPGQPIDVSLTNQGPTVRIRGIMAAQRKDVIVNRLLVTLIRPDSRGLSFSTRLSRSSLNNAWEDARPSLVKRDDGLQFDFLAYSREKTEFFKAALAPVDEAWRAEYNTCTKAVPPKTSSNETEYNAVIHKILIDLWSTFQSNLAVESASKKLMADCFWIAGEYSVRLDVYCLKHGTPIASYQDKFKIIESEVKQLYENYSKIMQYVCSQPPEIVGAHYAAQVNYMMID
jgi:hypothetical protein